MALTLGDNFSYQGAKPLDARLKYDTLAAMKAVADATMYNGCTAYCEEVDKTYQWKSTNTVDESTGKWREFSSGGGGGSTYTAGDGIDITEDVISIDPMSAEDMDDVIDELPTGGNIAVTGYVPLGTLIPYYGETAPKFFLACDGSTYNKADYPELAKHLLSLTNNTPYIVDGDDTKFKVPDLRGEFIRGTGTNSHTNQGDGENVGEHQDATEHLGMYKYTNNNVYIGGRNEYVAPTNMDTSTMATNGRSDVSTSAGSTNDIKTYTSRPTNTSVLFCIAYKDIYSNPMNDYSTDEKVVGTWIDGKTIYQKTYDITSTLNFQDNTWLSTSITIPDGKNCINATLIDKTSGAIATIWATINPSTKVLSLLMSRTNSYVNGVYITLQYTKTTD